MAMTIEEWDTSLLMDWSRRRDEMKPLFYQMAGATLAAYASLSVVHKLIGAKYFFVPVQLRVGNGTVTLEQDKINWKFLGVECKQSRIECAEAMRLYMVEGIRNGEIKLQNTQRFLRDIIVYRELFIDSNDPMFKQWLTNEVGSAVEFKGFKNTSYWSQYLQDGLMAIYNGAY